MHSVLNLIWAIYSLFCVWLLWKFGNWKESRICIIFTFFTIRCVRKLSVLCLGGLETQLEDIECPFEILGYIMISDRRLEYHTCCRAAVWFFDSAKDSICSMWNYGWWPNYCSRPFLDALKCLMIGWLGFSFYFFIFLFSLIWRDRSF